MTPAGAPRHGCPGPGCSSTVPLQQLACRRCWRLLPAELQKAVTTAYRAWRRFPADVSLAFAHRAAVTEALRWYRSQP